MNPRERPVWQRSPNIIPAGLRNTLQHSGSLTGLLEKQAPLSFNLELISQSWQKPLLDEARLLSIGPARFAFVREIVLRFDKRPLVYGRSIIPRKTLSGAERQLANWGQRSLGDYLFTRQGVERGVMEYARIPAWKTYYSMDRLFSLDKDEVLWGRRSIFHVNSKPLLVIEIFLPEFSLCNMNG